MTHLKLTDVDARRLYSNASTEMKTIFEQTFGVTFFLQRITDVIQNWDDILRYLGITSSFLPYQNPGTAEEKSVNAMMKLFKIASVYNEGVVLDWNNSSIYKYFVYKYKNSSGGWVLDSGGWTSDLYCPGGLYFKSDPLLQDALTKFPDIFNDFFQ